MKNRTRLARLVAPGVRGLDVYVPGKPLEELEREYGIHDALKLASNENPLGPSPLGVDAVLRAAGSIALYPDGSGYALRRALAARLGVDPDQVTLGNGSNDLLVLMAEAFLTARTEAVYSEHAFLVYRLAVQATGAVARVARANPPGHAQPLGHDLDEMRRQIGPRTRLVYIANPNNPTGTWLGDQPLREFLSTIPEHVFVVLDEAYCEYVSTPQYPRTIGWLGDHPNLVVMRTFSKIYGLAGLRVGYAISSTAIAEVLNRVRQPFNVNSLGLAAALAALGDDGHVMRSREMNAQGMLQLTDGLAALGFNVGPSAGNFVLLDCGRPAGAVYETLLRQGIIVRPLGAYALPNHLRVTVGLPDQNARFLEGLGEIVAGSRAGGR
jgi:histidinol-phosphate aminotransferase